MSSGRTVKRRWVTLIVPWIVVTGCASSGSHVGADSKSDETRYAEMLKQGQQTVVKGAPKRAIAESFDPVIAHYENLYKAEKRKIFTARDTGESLLYLLESATEKQGAIVVGPTWSEAYFLKAYASVDLGDLNTAEAMLKKALALAPENSTYWAELGQLYATRQELSEALEAYRQSEASASFSPEEVSARDHARAWRGLGYVLVEQGKLDEAENYYRRCLSQDPKDDKAQNEIKYIEEQRKRQAR